MFLTVKINIHMSKETKDRINKEDDRRIKENYKKGYSNKYF